MVLLLGGCREAASVYVPPPAPPRPPAVVYGAEVLLASDSLLAELRDKRLGLVANHTTRVFDRLHVLDTLLALGFDVRRVFAPEHGFRGAQEAGDSIDNGIDHRSGLPIFSLYGETKKPTRASLADIDILLFDIQDVGTRFYTYLTTLALVQEACAENGTALWVLDRPNPNGHAVAGPVLQQGWESFVGAHPVPILHGMTLGEYARMINGEGWLAGQKQARLTVVPVRNWWHGRHWESGGRPWLAPSPNLPTPRAARLYAGLCWFEGTQVSVGRGTAFPFEQVGFPGFVVATGSYAMGPSPLQPVGTLPVLFLPTSQPGRAAEPLHMGLPCTGAFVLGAALSADSVMVFGLRVLAQAYAQYPGISSRLTEPTGLRKPFFNPVVPTNPWFEKLTGGPGLRRQVEQGLSAQAIAASWAAEVALFRDVRRPYLLYPEE